MISLHVYNNLPYKITLLLGNLVYCDKNATFHKTEEKAIGVNNPFRLPHICQPTLLNEEISKIPLQMILNETRLIA